MEEDHPPRFVNSFGRHAVRQSDGDQADVNPGDTPNSTSPLSNTCTSFVHLFFLTWQDTIQFYIQKYFPNKKPVKESLNPWILIHQAIYQTTVSRNTLAFANSGGGPINRVFFVWPLSTRLSKSWEGLVFSLSPERKQKPLHCEGSKPHNTCCTAGLENCDSIQLLVLIWFIFWF